LLLGAAREVFAEQGVEARLDVIARRAGVGVATLYRHFPTRADLVEALFAERVDELLVVAQSALAEADAWAGLVWFLEAMLELQRGDRVLKEIFLRYPPGEGRLARARQEMRQLFEQILARAREQGSLRADFTVSDLTMLLWSFAPVMDATAEASPRVWRRHLHWLLDGLRAESATAQTEPPLDDEQLSKAMQCLRERRFQRRAPAARAEEATAG
jgi:AcrR family transcriptional regulator